MFQNNMSSKLDGLITYKKEIFLINKNDSPIDKAAKEFFLTLALIFNDAKGLEWFLEKVEKQKPSNIKKVTAKLGEYTGFKCQIVRLQMSIHLELLNVIDDYKKYFNDDPFLKIINDLKGPKKILWNNLVSFNYKNKAEYSKYVGFLHKVRSNAAFHYSSKALISSYKLHFDDSELIKQKAFVSIGKGMESTRFYFADAAASALVEKELKDNGFDQKYLQKISKQLNEPVKILIESFLMMNKIFKD